MRPPCSIDDTAEDASQRDPHGTGAAPSPRQAVHDECVVLTEGLVSGRSEKVGCSTGCVEVSPDESDAGTSG
jgi:hypothetical protein